MVFMLFIFLLEVVFSFLPRYVSDFTTLIARYVFTITDEELNLRSELKDLKDRLSGLSMTDEFARYAKLERQVNKLISEIKERDGERKQRIAYLRMGVMVGIYVLHAVIILTMMILMRNEPLMTVPSSWLFPFEKIVAFPTGKPGAIGLGCWLFVSNSVIYRFRAMVKV